MSLDIDLSALDAIPFGARPIFWPTGYANKDDESVNPDVPQTGC